MNLVYNTLSRCFVRGFSNCSKNRDKDTNIDIYSDNLQKRQELFLKFNVFELML